MRYTIRQTATFRAFKTPFDQTPLPALSLATLLALAACTQPQDAPAEPPEPEPVAKGDGADETDTVSILRPEIDPPEAEPTPEPLGPFKTTIGFPDGGKKLNANAVAALEAALASDQLDLGLPITLSAHSDSAGTDTLNLDVSEERGLAVAQWLIDKGVDPDRITVVAFGEQNPIEPNALPDGSPNERGRSINRRVEIEIAASLPAAQASPEPDGAATQGTTAQTASGESVSVKSGD